MGWFSNYRALKQNKCSDRRELEKKNPQAYNYANGTNVWGDYNRAWDIAEQKIKESKRKQRR